MNNKTLNKLIVFTGGPFSGKTTTLTAFKEQGYTVIDETAIEIIDELKNELGITRQQAFLKEQAVDFQNLIFHRQAKKESDALQCKHKENIIFLDRSLVDGLGYLHFNKIPWNEQYKNLAMQNKYNMVIILDTLSDFNNRAETGRIDATIENSHAIRNSILFAYKFLGYQPYLIPDTPLENRFQNIKKLIF